MRAHFAPREHGGREIRPRQTGHEDCVVQRVLLRATPTVVDGLSIAAEAARRVVERVEDAESGSLEEAVNEALYHERERLLHAADDERRKHDRAFAQRVARTLAEGDPAEHRRLLRAIVERYANEIAGHFDPRVYRVATGVLPVGLTALLNGLSPRRAIEQFPVLPRVTEHVHISGEVETLRGLSQAGTVVLAPTHSSNLDAVLLGYSIFRMGLPPFAYGAGLNLFTSALIGFFMHNLGAYTVDRTKTDPLYKSTLKEYATVSLERGQHNLYFPGGTRSRSGAVESKLKRGLLGASLTALSNNVRRGKPNPKVFVFPCTCTYPLVLEAASLIDAHLERTGKSRYIHPPPDEFDRPARWLEFMGSLITLDLDVHVRIGRPLDPFGCDVDPTGVSRDPRGREIEPTDYLRYDGAFVADPARDHVYTAMLTDAIAKSYRRNTVALATSVLAYAVFERFRRGHAGRDLYRLLRRLGPGSSADRVDLVADVGRLLGELRQLAAGGEIVLSDEVRASPGSVVERGLRTFATYHAQPVLREREGRIYLGDANLLFFYRNRLDGYGLLGCPPLAEDGAQ